MSDASCLLWRIHQDCVTYVNGRNVPELCSNCFGNFTLFKKKVAPHDRLGDRVRNIPKFIWESSSEPFLDLLRRDMF